MIDWGAILASHSGMPSSRHAGIYGYVMNQMGGLVGDPRAVALCHAAFANA